MNVRRVGIVYDDSIRPETTGVYCRRALDELVREGRLDTAVHLRPEQLPGLAAGEFDLYLFVDDGIVSGIPDTLRPAAWWAIDTHLGFERCLAVARQAAWTFCAQRDGAAQLRLAGVESATWLPLACDPDLHGRIETPHQWDVAFVGHVVSGERQRLIDLVRARYPRSFFGNRYFREMAETYSASKCVFNRSIANDVNMRVFEGLCSGSLLVTNALDANGLEELLQSGRHLVTYASDGELLDALAHYLAHDDERAQIAAAGRAEVLARHTYRHRVETLLAGVAQPTPAQIKSSCSQTRCCKRGGPCRGSGKRCRKRRQKSRPRDLPLGPGNRNGSTARPNNEQSHPIRRTVQTKEPAYFEFDRPEILELVPESARRVLDIGCGAGRLGASIKARQQCEVVGIEFNPTAAALAGAYLDRVVVANLESDDLLFEPGEFDCVICADVLEHLREPAELLRKIPTWLSPSGCLVTSIPNVRNHTVVQSLLAGNWTYESAGLLDADHVRFFTRREIEKLLFRAGFDVGELRMMPGEGYAKWVQDGRPLDVSVGGLQIRAASERDAQEFFAYQWLARAMPSRQLRDNSSVALKSSPESSLAGRKQLAELHPWPAKRPDVSVPDGHAGWFGDGARAVLTQAVNSDSRLIVELGSWLGLSTRFLAHRAPHATIIAVDHWQGSPEHQRDPELKQLLPTLFEEFVASCWPYRDRILPLRMSTQEGLQAVAAAGLTPDLIFVDADHSYDAVCADLETSRKLFPEAVLTGDDFSDPDVRRAVEEFARTHGLQLQTFGRNWLGWQLTTPQQVTGAAPPGSFGLTSIVIPTHNQLAYTKACLDSIRLLTDEPHEIIMVDNGSTDGTVDYLRSLSDVRLIANESNRGFPAAVNQGIAIASGEQILLLNNDTIVTTGWLRRMLDVLHSDPVVGLVGPVSNQVSGEQQISVGYTQLAELDGWAWDRQAQFVPGATPGQHGAVDTDRLVGFCLLIKREVIDRIGVLDERFGIGCFEDDDYCRRASDAGYRAVIAPAAFVHHFGSATFRGSGVDLRDVLQRNERLYHEKWQTRCEQTPEKDTPTPATDSLVHGIACQPHASCGAPSATVSDNPSEVRPVRLSVCLIVRDNESTIRPCLESIRPWVDEMVVVDTGSTDRTASICEELGARVFHWAWRDDFAAARNVSLEHARGEWLFWMDSDDTIPADCGRQLRVLADQAHPEHVLGYVMQVQCPGDDPADVTVVDHVKLIRNRPDIRFEFRIHEQILPSIRRAGGEVEFTDIYVVHSGSDRSVEGQARKLERDFRLLELELRDRPQHPFVLFNLGMTCADCGRLPEAIDYLERCIAVSRTEESHLRKAFALLVSTLQRDNQIDAAIERCEAGLLLFSHDKELLFRRAMLHHECGELDQAVVVYRRVLDDSSDRHFTSIDSGLVGFKARHNLALVFEERGDDELAANEWQRILHEQPAYAPAWRGRAESLLRLGRTAEVLQLRASLAGRSRPDLDHLIPYISGRIAESVGDIDAALDAFREADRLEQPANNALRQLCRLLFATRRWEPACDALQELNSREPTDASVLHNLGIVHRELGELDNAAQAFQESLRLRPTSDETRDHLRTLRLIDRDGGLTPCLEPAAVLSQP